MRTISRITIICLAMLCSLSFSQETSSTAGNTAVQKETQTDFVTINGLTDESGEWGSGYIDLESMITLKKGTTLKVEVGGEAKKVLVRILVNGKSHDQAVGILGKFDVPENRIVEVKLAQDFKNIKQISVHGSPKAWSYSLGAANGNATLVSASWK